MIARAISTTAGGIYFGSLAVTENRRPYEPVASRSPALPSCCEIFDRSDSWRQCPAAFRSSPGYPRLCFGSSCCPTPRMATRNRYRRCAAIARSNIFECLADNVSTASRSVDRNARVFSSSNGSLLVGEPGDHDFRAADINTHDGFERAVRAGRLDERNRRDSSRLSHASLATGRSGGGSGGRTGSSILTAQQSLRSAPDHTPNRSNISIGSPSSARDFESVASLPRMTRDEELALAEDVQRWRSLERVRRNVCRGGAATDGEFRAWALAAGMSVADLREQAARAAGARERLVLSHIQLVMYLARRRGWSAGASPMDLVQEGAIALHVAVDRYDPSRGVRFFTYADWALRAAFEQTEANQAGAMAIPRYVHVEKRRLRAVILHETALRQRSPTRQELAEALDVPVERVAKLLRWSERCDSTDRALGSGDTLGEMLPGPRALEVHLQRLDAEAVLGRLLEGLKPREAEVIINLYGLFGTGKKSTVAVSGAMGVSRQYVGRVHQTALDKMRASLEQRPGPRAETAETSRSSNSGFSKDSRRKSAEEPMPAGTRVDQAKRRHLDRSRAI